MAEVFDDFKHTIENCKTFERFYSFSYVNFECKRTLLFCRKV